MVVPDQLYDNTKDRERTFFKEGIVGHISSADPFCPVLRNHLLASVKDAGGTVHSGGSYITVEGPRFSTRTESNTFRAWGMSMIGMTVSPEAFLAREAELCYAVLAHVTDYDVWHSVLNAEGQDHRIPNYDKIMLFQKEFTKEDWLQRAKDLPHTIQLVTPKLYLPDAKRIWVRNKKTKKRLEDMGFENIEVKRLEIDKY